MGRRIRWLGLVLVVCFAAVLAQLVNIQLRQASALDASASNPRNAIADLNNYRGNILAGDGTTVLGKSVAVPHPKPGQKKYYRTYPGGFLYSGIVGYDSTYYGSTGVENVYNTQLSLHSQKAKTLGQLLSPPPRTADDVTLTIQPTLQLAAYHAIQNTIRDANKDAAIVVTNPKTGAILAMYSNPSFDPNAVAQPTVPAEIAAHKAATVPDSEGFRPSEPMATFDRFPPGSTYKVVTTSAVYNLKPTLSGFTWGPGKCTGKGAIPGTSPTFHICNDAGTSKLASTCGGPLRVMLPESCDPGYVMLGLAVGGTAMAKQSDLFGINSVPPVDITGVNKSHFPSASDFTTQPTHLGRGGLALASFGQGTVSLTALQNALDASAVANTGAEMAPHVMSQIRNSQGALVQQYKPTIYKQVMSASAAHQVRTLMYLVANTPIGTAYGDFGSHRTEQVAAKTGTAQVTTTKTKPAVIDDWMIAFAPATDPTVAVSVVVPDQPANTYGATTAGPIVQTMIAATLAEERAHGVTPTTSTITTTPLPTTTTTTTTTTTVPSTPAKAAANNTPPAAPPTTTTAPAAPPTTTTTAPAAPPTTTTPPPAATAARFSTDRIRSPGPAGSSP